MAIIKPITPKKINGSPLSISVYSVTKEASHYHPKTIELVYCLKGTVSVISSYDLISLKSGDIICLNCNEVHGIFSEEENLLVSFHLDLSHSACRYPNAEHIMLKLFPDIAGAHQLVHLKELNGLLLSSLYLYSENRTASETVFTKISLQIAELLFEHFNVFCSNDDTADLLWSQDRFEQMLLYINIHYNERLTLKMLSEREHLNYNYLSNYFNQTFDDTFNNYLAVIRVYHSELFLLATDDTISSISYNCGFSAPKFYYKAFKQWYGTTPMEHRKRHRAYNDSAKPSRVYRIHEIHYTINQYITYYFSKSQLNFFDIPLELDGGFSPRSNPYSEWRSF